MRRAVLAAVLCAVLAVLPAHTASAKKAEKHGSRDGDAVVDVDVTVVFSPAQRDAVRDYQHSAYGRGSCPPGLAKKNNGCLPPGHAKKRYAVGKPLGAGVVIVDLPGDLQVRLGKPPKGTRYGIIDGDVVKLALGTLLVIDAIDGLAD